MKVTLKRFETLLQGELPAAQQTLYKWSSKKTVDWLDRQDPNGHRGRELWAHIEKYNEWAGPRGHRLIHAGGSAPN
ncbi:hypothetical protein D9M73_78690 [compost metagenome]